MSMWRFDGRLVATDLTGKGEFQEALEPLRSSLGPLRVNVNASESDLVIQLRVAADTRDQAHVRAIEEIERTLDSAELPITKRTWTLAETTNL